jgi:hypothetical protein
LFFFISTAIDGYTIFGSKKIDFQVTGQVGDFIGGLLGTLINGAAFYFLYLTLNEQRIENSKQADLSQKENFERKFYELVSLHRGNVSELKHKKNGELYEARTVFKILIEEFTECLHEVIRFAKMYPEMHDEEINTRYYEKLERIKKDNKLRAPVKEIALINLAYTIFYYGVSEDSETTYLHMFRRKYKNNYTNKLKYFLQLKPRKENIEGFKRWNDFISQDIEHMTQKFENIYENRRNFSSNPDTPQTADNLYSEKYYNGHQEQLGHYFRHLFQSFKFISIQETLSDTEKYFYAKTLRAQLSTHEQLLIFFNSISSLGLKWEYLAEAEKNFPNIPLEQFKIISKYDIIKNVPGTSFYNIKYRNFYSNIQYESIENNK